MKLKKLKLVGIHVSADDFRTHLRHLQSLEALKILFNRHPLARDQYGQICHLLLDNQIFVKQLIIDCTSPPAVFRYLSSYSGLERLELHPRHPGDDSSELVHRFFSSILPLHSLSLRILSLGWCVKTAWTSVTREDLVYVAKCQMLRKLRCWATVIRPTHAARTDQLLVGWFKNSPITSSLRNQVDMVAYCHAASTATGVLLSPHHFESTLA